MMGPTEHHDMAAHTAAAPVVSVVVAVVEPSSAVCVVVLRPSRFPYHF